MVAFAALTGPLPKLGVVVVAALAACVLLLSSRRARAAVMLGALVLAPALLLADIWHSPQLRIIHRHPLLAVAGAAALVVVLLAAAVLIRRRPSLLPILTVVALPFRVPIQSGGTTANLLVPLYFVIAAGALAWMAETLRPRRSEGRQERAPAALAVGWLERALAAYLILYAIQAVYSGDFERALQNVVFFYVPFALLFALLTEVQWSRGLVRACFQVVVVLAVVFAAIAFGEYATKTIILNPKLVVQNDLHTYFVVNSVFFDPDIFGRFLALVMITLAALLLYERSGREQAGAAVVLAVLWGGLLLTLSRSSLAALLVGLAVLAALRWRLYRAAAAAAIVVVIGAIAVAASPTTFGLNQGLNGVSSGRGSLLSGGLSMFGDRPGWGYGSGSFETEYHARHPSSGPLTASHTIPVTIAAEQGVIGELAYVALVLAGIATLVRGARGDPARAAIAAAFVALVFHAWLYADFLEDPFTWTLLGMGAALARAPAMAAASLRAPQATAATAAPSLASSA